MEESLSRKLAVLLHADVVASTALVQANETLAHHRIRDAFHRFSGTIEAYSVDSPYTLAKIDFWDFKDPVARERLREGLRKAGLLEGKAAAQ